MRHYKRIGKVIKSNKSLFNACLFAGYAFRDKKYSKYRKWTHCLFCEPLCYLNAVSFPVRDEVMELCDNLVASLNKIKLF